MGEEDSSEVFIDEEKLTKSLPKQMVQKAFKDTWLNDFGVLIMVFVSIGHFVFGYMTSSEAASDKENCGKESVGATLAMINVSTLFCFWFSYYCCACCSKSVALPYDVYAEQTGKDRLIDKPEGEAEK